MATARPPLPTGRPLSEVFENFAAQDLVLVELFEIQYELLVNCRLRKQLGPAQLSMPAAPTVIEQTLWIPWVAQGSSWLFGEFSGGELTEPED